MPVLQTTCTHRNHFFIGIFLDKTSLPSTLLYKDIFYFRFHVGQIQQKERILNRLHARCGAPGGAHFHYPEIMT